MSRSCIKISDRVILGIHKSASSSHMSVANLCWLQTLHVQHSQMFCMLQAFQNMDHFQQILDRLWSICATLFFFFAVLIVSSPEAFWIIQIVFTQKCSSLMKNLMQICCSTRSVISNAMATQYTCSLSGICCSHWLVQWSWHYSCTYIPNHSPWLPGYIDVVQTILIILIMAGLFLDSVLKHTHLNRIFLLGIWPRKMFTQTCT